MYGAGRVRIRDRRPRMALPDGGGTAASTELRGTGLSAKTAGGGGEETREQAGPFVSRLELQQHGLDRAGWLAEDETRGSAVQCSAGRAGKGHGQRRGAAGIAGWDYLGIIVVNQLAALVSPANSLI